MQTTGLNRDIIDKFYTKATVVKQCCDILKEHVDINNDLDIIIEPSAGNGAFITKLSEICSNCIFYDIQPDNPAIIKQDYLELDVNSFELPDIQTKFHIIGNPPFGRQSSLAIKFIKKSADFCDTISFILPKSFKKDSMQRHFPMNFHLVYQCDLESNSFIINSQTTIEKEKDVPCIFQIWKKSNLVRESIVKKNAVGFVFVKREENPDISFRRVGVNAGKIDVNNLQEKSIQSHYFIKFNEQENKTEIINKIGNIKYETNNTVGPKSISKQEIIQEINKIFL